MGEAELAGGTDIIHPDFNDECPAGDAGEAGLLTHKILRQNLDSR